MNCLNTPELFCASVYGQGWVGPEEEKFHHSPHLSEKQILFLFALSPTPPIISSFLHLIWGCWILESHFWQEKCSSSFDNMKYFSSGGTKRWSVFKKKLRRLLLTAASLPHVRSPMKAAEKGAESVHRGLRRHTALALYSGSVPPPANHRLCCYR